MTYEQFHPVHDYALSESPNLQLNMQKIVKMGLLKKPLFIMGLIKNTK